MAAVESQLETSAAVGATVERRPRAIPLFVKIAFTLFFIVHGIFNIEEYGPQTYLWYCNTAILTGLLGMWLENRMLVSMCAIATIVPLGVIWTIDYISPLLFNGKRFAFVAAYMADPSVPLPVRLISTFHFWLPILACWMVYRIGYHRWAWLTQTAYVAVVMTLSYWVSVRVGTSNWSPVNINWVYGLEPTKPHRNLSDPMFVAALIGLFCVVIYIPSHLMLMTIIALWKRFRQGSPVRHFEPLRSVNV